MVLGKKPLGIFQRGIFFTSQQIITIFNNAQRMKSGLAISFLLRPLKTKNLISELTSALILEVASELICTDVSLLVNMLVQGMEL